MGSIAHAERPHAVCVPYPLQGHINPMIKLAKLLHFRGFHITFVNTIYNHNRLLRSRGPSALDGLADFRFEKIPDGLPPSDADVSQDIPSLCQSFAKNCTSPLCDLISRLNDSGASGIPPVTCIVSDGCMSFTLKAAEKFGIPEILFWTPSACGFLGYTRYASLVEKGLVPLKDESCHTNGYMETTIEWLPGMDIRLKDLPSFIRTTDPNDVMLNYLIQEAEATSKGTAIVINTFDAFESGAVAALSATMRPPVYTIGPLELLLEQITDDRLKSIGSNLWRDEPDCVNWLNSKEPGSVVYVSFGSITVMTAEQLVEFAWGLANSGKSFLWIIRPDLVAGESAILPPEFVEETKERGMLASWCPQDEVLKHPAIAGFLTHSGWNSTMETVCGGVPVICWPFFAEQPTNCRYSCTEWGIGLEIDNNVKRDEVEKLVGQLMAEEKGRDMKRRILEWKKAAEDAAMPGGSSAVNLERLFKEVLLPN